MLAVLGQGDRDLGGEARGPNGAPSGEIIAAPIALDPTDMGVYVVHEPLVAEGLDGHPRMLSGEAWVHDGHCRQVASVAASSPADGLVCQPIR